MDQQQLPVPTRHPPDAATPVMRPHHVPGPLGLFTGLRLFASRDLHAAMRKLVETYGDLVGCRIGRRRMFIVNQPEWIREILVNQHTHFIKAFSFRRLQVVLGNGLITSNGEFHRQQRRMIQPAFDRGHLEHCAASVTATTAKLCSAWQPSRPQDISVEMLKLTVTMLANSLLDADLGAEAETLLEAVTAGNQAYADTRIMPGAVWLLQLPTPGVRRLRNTFRKVDELAYRLIRARRQPSSTHRDLLSFLIHARDESGQPMPDQQLRDELVTILLAGFETSAMGLTWALGLLAQHPHIQQQLQQEIDSTLDGRPATPADLPNIDGCRRVLAEALRLYPPISVLGRKAIQDVALGPYRIPRGSQVVFSQWLLHRDPRYWPEPERFDPDRWQPERQRQHHKYAYFPFGGGPRICLGEPMFWMTAPLMLATILQRWSFQLAPNATLDVLPQVTLRPRGGLWLLPTPRVVQGTQPLSDPVPVEFGQHG